MTIALDLGSHQFRSLRRQSDQLLARSCRSVYSVLPASPTQQHLLTQAQIPFAVCDDQLVLMGDAAVELSRLFQVPNLPLLPRGHFRANDPLPRQITAALIEQLLPDPHYAGEICCMSLPEIAALGNAREHAELDFMTQVIRLKGYTPLVLGSAMAAILAHLSDRAFTGIGMVFGANFCDVALAHHGLRITGCTLPRGGDWLDREMARTAGDYAWQAQGERYLDVDAARRRKESVTESLLQPTSAEEHRLADLYRQLIRKVLRVTTQRLNIAAGIADFPQPITIACTGGSAQVAGFHQLVAESLLVAPLPLEISHVRVCAHADHDIARGCLINAELETEARRKQQSKAA